MAKEYQEKRSSFAERLKTAPTLMPMQKVEPVEVKEIEPPKEEVQINAWIPKDLMKQVKTRAVVTEKSIKEIVIIALENYLKA